MNRIEFMTKLQEELQSIPSDERDSAIKYYTEYFDDAGVENEQQVLSELESPVVIARKIKADLGYVKEEKAGQEEQGGTTGTNNSNGKTAEEPGATKGKKNILDQKIYLGNLELPLLAVIFIAILLIPVILPAISGIFGVLIGIVFGAIGIAIGFFAAAVGILVAGMAVTAWGISMMIAGMVMNGVLAVGLGLILIGIGLLFAVLAIQLAAVWIPAGIRSLVNLIRRCCRKKPARAVV